MVTSDETVLATTTNKTSITTEPMEPKSSDESTDSETDKIKILKAEQREALTEATGSVEVNGNEENGHVECATVDEVAHVEEDKVEEATNSVVDLSSNGSSATTSVPVEEQEEKANEDETNDVVMETSENGENGKEENGTAMEVAENPAVTENGSKSDGETETDGVAIKDSQEDDSEPVNGSVKPEEKEEKNDTDAPMEEEDQNGKGVKRPVECIQLDDDDDDIQEVSPPVPAKKQKTEETKQEPKQEAKAEPADDNEQAQIRLLDKLQEYVGDQRGQPCNKTRKVLDTLLGAINAQVQKEPLSVRKLILDKVLVLPNTISFPPSQVCDLLIEHDPEMPLAKVINRMFGEERPKLSDAEKRERQQMKQHNPVSHMTKLLVDIGQDLVQETTYCDIVHAKNLPEIPKNIETYKQVAAQLKPVWETLKRKNEPYKLKMSRCGVCGFQTESKLAMAAHKETLHFTGSKFQCTLCKETDTNEQRMKEHYFEAHLIIAKSEEKESKYPCAICEEDFNFKGVREQHYKQCKKDYIRIRNIMMPKQEDHLYLNRWLWERPPVDPSIIQQQQAAALQQAEQKKRHQQALLREQHAQAQAAQLLRKQQLQQQQQAQRLREQQAQAQYRQMAQLIQQQQQQQNRNNANNMSNSLIQAMQAQLRRSGTGTSPQNLNLLQKQMAAVLKNQNPAQIQALVASMNKQTQSPKTPTTPKVAKAAATPTLPLAMSASSSSPGVSFQCEICDQTVHEKDKYLSHLQVLHKQMVGKTLQDMTQGAPLACSRCRDRFWTYEGLERHLVMSHGLVTADLLLKAQKKEDGGRCKTCGKQYAFNMLQHLVADHQVKLCSAEIMYSCDVCAFKCSSYQTLEAHLSSTHPKSADKKKEELITLDD
ncbi:hypothetical protein L3Y34_004315 [Caenorhabditis briggsae]|uniref:MOG interacting and ectopic P-granules protein 1 n=2 Tax=Caenorhabditis briggsae TaxID=6238 RepID=A0AAE9AFE3_CAEBR|nr:hypothetical protein L3Y34_004315 [Caenorhabditis briggsae]